MGKEISTITDVLISHGIFNLVSFPEKCATSLSLNFPFKVEKMRKSDFAHCFFGWDQIEDTF